MRTLGFTLAFALLGASTTAQAHFGLMSPTTTDTDGKGPPPCGPDGSTAAPVAAQGGHPITLTLKETVPHPGFYRVALSINSRSELPVDPVVKDSAGKILPADGSTKGISKTAEYTDTPVFPVLADHLFAHTGAPMPMYTTMLTLPNVTCARCTLQVIEFMADHGYNATQAGTSNGGYFYHHCADLKITADPNLPAFVAPNKDGGASDAPSDVKPGNDGSAGTGASGAGGTSGTAGTGAGVAGTSGAAGGGAAGTTGAAGASVGAAGTNGGSAGTTGAAGNTTGTAGTTAGGGGSTEDGGGCACTAAGQSGSPTLLLVAAAVSYLVARRRIRRSQ